MCLVPTRSSRFTPRPGLKSADSGESLGGGGTAATAAEAATKYQTEG